MLLRCPQEANSNQPDESELFQLRSRANQSTSDRRFAEACELYSKAIRLAEELKESAATLSVLYSNRSHCYISLGRGQEALTDAEAALTKDPSNKKSYFRRARALLLVYEPYEAAEAIKQCRALSDEEQAEFDSDCLRMRCELAGEYDEVLMIREAEDSPDHNLSPFHVNFVSEAVTLHSSCTDNRGVRAVRDIPAMTLILAEKAFVATPAKQPSPNAQSIDLYPSLLQKLADSSDSAINQFLTLFPCPSDSTLTPSSFSPSSAAKLTEQEEKQLRSIIQHNTLAMVENPVSSTLEEIEWARSLNDSPSPEALRQWKEGRKTDRQGLWLWGSMFNHSCAPNAVYYTIGDFLLIRMVRPIVAGQEILISYLPIHAPFEERTQTLQSRWGIQCNCERCIASRASPAFSLNEQLVFSSYRQSLTHSGQLSTERIETLLPKPKRDELFKFFNESPPASRLALTPLIEMEATVHLRSSDFTPALTLVDQAIATTDATSDFLSQIWKFSSQALCLIADDQLPQATKVITQALAVCRPFLSIPIDSLTFSSLVSRLATSGKDAVNKQFEELVAEVVDNDCLSTDPYPPASFWPKSSTRRTILYSSNHCTPLDRLPIISKHALSERDSMQIVPTSSPSCDACGALNKPLMVCTGCSAARYCSRECQKKAWKEGHKTRCRPIAASDSS